MAKHGASKNIQFGIILSYVSMGVSLLGTLFVTNRVLNYIGDYNFGLYAFVNSITAWVSVISSALTGSYLRYATISKKEENNGSKLADINSIYFKLLLFLGVSVLMLGGVVLLFLYGFRVNIGQYDWSDSELMYILFGISLLNIAITMPVSVFSLFITFRQKFIFEKTLNICMVALNFIGHFLIAFFTHSILFISAFSLIITALTFASNFIYCKKIGITFSKVSLLNYRPLVKSIIAFSSILLFNSIVDQVNSGVDKTLLGIFSTPEMVTIYQMGQQFNVYLVTMSISVSGVFAPRMHALVVEKNERELSSLYLKISKVQTVILCLVVFGFLACGQNFILWWIGPSRSDAFYVGLGLMLVDLCPLTMNSSIEIQRALNKHKFRAITYFLVALGNVGLSILFLYIFPKEKAILACLLGSVIARLCSHWLAMNIYNKKKIGLPVGTYMATLFLYMVIGFLCAASVYLFDISFISNINNVLARFLIEGILFAVEYLLVAGFLNKRTILRFFNSKKEKQ